jgi:hypothetical protein
MVELMGMAGAIEQVERVTHLQSNANATKLELQAGLADVRVLRSFFDSAEANFARRIAAGSSFPEKDVAEAAGGTLNDAGRILERTRTLDAAPEMAAALDAGRISGSHVDVLSRAARHLDDKLSGVLFDKVADLVDVAAVATVPDFAKRLRHEVSRILADDGVARLERQRRSTALSTWVDDEGMWRMSGKFDPVTGIRLAATLESTVETLFAEAESPMCPTDPIEKQKYLRALALSRLIERAGAVGLGNSAESAPPRTLGLRHGAASRPKSGRPEFVAVIDVSLDQAARGYCPIIPRRNDNLADAAEPNTNGSRADGSRADGSNADADPTPTSPLCVTWPIPVEVPNDVLAELLGDDLKSEVSAVVIADGLVLHAPGRLDLGRATRLANRAQRRALRGLYSSCAIPGCRSSYDRCQLHHITWWRHGGRTDLANLLPVCSHHHHKIHDDDWAIELGLQRALTLRLPDGQVMTTGPPTRTAA